MQYASPLNFSYVYNTEILTVIDLKGIYNKRNYILCNPVEESI